METSTEVCSVAVGMGEQCLSCVESDIKNSHAEKIALFIEQALEEAKISTDELKAVCISQGPGSYTGLRIGTSIAKGLSYALDIPLIAEDALHAVAWAARNEKPTADVFIPMIDAGRMEVYATFLNNNLQTVQPLTNLILDEHTFLPLLEQKTVVFCGNANQKLKPLYALHAHAFFSEIKLSAKYLLPWAYPKFIRHDFTDTAYFEPCYLKEFRAGTPKIKGL
jgi:tRNA threonylcarbamoyladenosine biosynthesis protein TsaB